ncbi:MAG: DUF4105 domain-containing protein [Patescibacteria group bacterium]
MYTFYVALRFILRTLIFLFVLAVCAIFISHLVMAPSNIRDWSNDQDTLAYAQVVASSSIVTLHNIRNFTYASTTSYNKSYYDRTVDVRTIKRVWYIVEPFSGIPGSAHTFLSFEFEDETFLAVSVEIRKEKGEEFNPIKGLFDQYELMYVWADERDAVKLRTNYRKDKLYMYPIKSTPEKVQKLFMHMINRTNDLVDHPEFYNTITNTCTTNIVDAVNQVSPGKIAMLNLGVLFPESSDKMAYNLGLFDVEVGTPFSEVRKMYYVNDKALKYADDVDFSTKIRTQQ